MSLLSSKLTIRMLSDSELLCIWLDQQTVYLTLYKNHDAQIRQKNINILCMNNAGAHFLTTLIISLKSNFKIIWFALKPFEPFLVYDWN